MRYIMRIAWLLVISGMLCACSSEKLSNFSNVLTTPQIQTPVLVTSDNYSLLQDREFDDPSDLTSIELGKDPDLKLTSDQLLKDGVLRIGAGVPVEYILLHQPIHPGQFYHVKMRVSEGVCFPIGIDMNGNYKVSGEMYIRSNGCTGDPISTEAALSLRDKPNLFGKLVTSGEMIIQPDEWIDFFFWLHPEGDRVYYLAGSGDQVVYGSTLLTETWQTGDAIFRLEFWGDSSTQQMDIAFIRMGDGLFSLYLTKNLPEYQKYQDELINYFEIDPNPFPVLSQNYSN